MSDNNTSDTGRDPSAFGEVPVQVTVTIGRASPTIGDLLAMSPSTIMALDKTLDDPVELYVGERLIARGQLEELDEAGSGQLGVRVTEIVQTQNST